MAVMDHINPCVAKLIPYQPGKTTDEIQRTYGLEHVVKLASNECPLPPSKKVIEAIHSHLSDMARYPEDAAPALRQKLANLNHVSPEQITFGSGSSEILEMLIRSFTQPGDNIVTSEHAFALYKILATAADVQTQSVPDLDWQQNLDGMMQAINGHSRIVFLTNPNNPTGTWIRQAPLFDFIRQAPKDVLIVVDEAYTEFMDQHDYATAVPLIAEHDNVVVARTFSKAYGLAGLRFGYCISSPEIADMLNRLRKPFNISNMTLSAASAALDDTNHLESVIKNNQQGMQQFTAALDALGLEYIDTTGNFLAVNFGEKALEINQQLLERGVIVRPLKGYNMANYLRISIGTPEENQACIDQLNQLLQ